jgi:hypothetical protein
MTFEQAFKILSTAGAIGTFLWTVYVWRDKARKDSEAAKQDAERESLTRRIEATKPFLELQLRLYTEATQMASIIATSEFASEIDLPMKRFKQLFAGELALVENTEVASAMEAFRRALPTLQGETLPRSDREMERLALLQLSLNLAYAFKNSLARSWGIRAWANPDDATQEPSQGQDSTLSL